MIVDIPAIGVDAKFALHPITPKSQGELLKLESLFKGMAPAITCALGCAVCVVRDGPGNGPHAETLREDDRLLVFMECDQALDYITDPSQGDEVARSKLACSRGSVANLHLG